MGALGNVNNSTLGFLLNKETGELKALNWKTGWNGVKMSDAELDN